MGLYSEIRVAPVNFGTSESIVELVVFGRKPELKKCWIALIHSVPSSDQVAL